MQEEEEECGLRENIEDEAARGVRFRRERVCAAAACEGKGERVAEECEREEGGREEVVASKYVAGCVRGFRASEQEDEAAFCGQDRDTGELHSSRTLHIQVLRG